MGSVMKASSCASKHALGVRNVVWRATVNPVGHAEAILANFEARSAQHVANCGNVAQTEFIQGSMTKFSGDQAGHP